MNAIPLSALAKTHEQCKKCGVWVPSKFLSCPACLGLQRRNEKWIVPGKRKVKKQEPVQEPSLFDSGTQEYPQ
jgi:hypothetical protein